MTDRPHNPHIGFRRPVLVDAFNHRYGKSFTPKDAHVYLEFPDGARYRVDREVVDSLEISTETDDYVVLFPVPKGDGHVRVAVPLGLIAEFARKLFPDLEENSY
jgi:hypothetical protein